MTILYLRYTIRSFHTRILYQNHEYYHRLCCSHKEHYATSTKIPDYATPTKIILQYCHKEHRTLCHVHKYPRICHSHEDQNITSLPQNHRILYHFHKDRRTACPSHEDYRILHHSHMHETYTIVGKRTTVVQNKTTNGAKTQREAALISNRAYIFIAIQ